MAEERLQKILARAGVASRRKAEELITSGRVRVDGKIVSELGAKADPKRAKIELDGKRLEREPLCYGIFHKPRGMVTTLSDPEGRPTASDVLREVGLRVVPVGRLDFNTSGALLFTNDGDFAHAMQHAKGRVPKVYAAKVQVPVDEKILERWAESIEIEGKKTSPAKVRVLRREEGKTWLEVIVKEGKNHQIRRLGDHAGTPVQRLARLSHGEITTDGIRPGHWRLLTIDELKGLKKRYGVPEKIRGVVEVAPGRRKDRAAAGAKARKAPSSPKKKAAPQKGAAGESRGKSRAGSQGGATGRVRGSARRPGKRP